MDKENEFIASAISDVQATIRATDVKIGLLLAAMSIPSGKFSEIKHFFESGNYTFYNECFFYLLCIFFLAIFLFLLLAISAIDNPSKHVKGGESCKGSYYSGGLFKLSFLDAFINRGGVVSNSGVDEHSLKYPESELDIKKELTYEHMKLVYIRDVKLFRLSLAYKTFFIFLYLIFFLMAVEYLY